MTMPGRRGKARREIVSAARAQRRRATPAEARLWSALRNRQLGGLKVRRNHPHGRFVLDAFCVEHQLEVEIDGPYHLDPRQAEYDAARTAYLESVGVRVLRFTNDAVLNHLDLVLDAIVAAVRAGAASPPP
jgi:very-short-patch-repair endonuclease